MTDKELGVYVDRNGFSGYLFVEFVDGELMEGTICNSKYISLFPRESDEIPSVEQTLFFFIKREDVMKCQEDLRLRKKADVNIIKQIMPDSVVKIISREEYYRK